MRGRRVWLTLVVGGCIVAMSRDGDRLSEMVATRNTRPVSRQMVGRWFKQAERLAGIAHIRGRDGCGLRRATVGGARKERVPEEATKNLFGWKDLTMVGTYGEEQPDWALQEASQFLLKPAAWGNRMIGAGGIRTLDTVTRIPVLQTGAFSHSATAPDAFAITPLPYSDPCSDLIAISGASANLRVFVPN